VAFWALPLVRPCNVCSREFERTPEFWPRHPKGYEGLHGTCKLCTAKIYAERYKRTREFYLARQKEYRKRLRSPGSRRDEYQNDREARVAYGREYRARNREVFNRKQREYAAANAESVAKTKKASNAKRSGAPGKFTVADIDAKFAAQRGLCFYCSRTITPKTFHVDHYIPLSRGGTNEPSNIVLACAKCNLSKHTALPEHFKPKE
jgi:5-methylcytosine-specific restriction endonuclease McrA